MEKIRQYGITLEHSKHSERVLMSERERLNAILAELTGKLKKAILNTDKENKG